MSNPSVSFEEEKWDIVITPPKKWLWIDFQELWNYKYLLFLLVKRDFTAAFKQNILGPLWFIIQPLTTTGIYSIIFGEVAKLPTDGVPQPLFYIIGITFWGFFQSILTSNSSALTGNSGLFGKVYFPRLIPPLATSISQLYKFLIQFAQMLVVFLFYFVNGASIQPNIWILCFPLVMFQHALLGLGLGLWISAWTVKYRDLGQLVGFGMSLWMWATPIVYPLSMVQGNSILKQVLWLNPVSAGLDLVRYGFTGAGSADLLWWAYGWAWSILVFLIGVALYQRASQTFVDVV